MDVSDLAQAHGYMRARIEHLKERGGPDSKGENDAN